MLPARKNPFAVHRLEELPYRFPEDYGWKRLLAALRQSNYRGAITGAEGSGKTALLLQLLTHWENEGLKSALLTLKRGEEWKNLRLLCSFLCKRSRTEIIAVDGAEQIPLPLFMLLRVISFCCGGLIITTHRPGRLTRIYHCRTSWPLLQDLVSTLQSGIEVAPEYAAALFERHGGNIRAALLECYDGCNSL